MGFGQTGLIVPSIDHEPDVRLVGIADSTGNRAVSGSIQGYLAGVIS